jgi:hypothetical protein
MVKTAGGDATAVARERTSSLENQAMHALMEQQAYCGATKGNCVLFNSVVACLCVSELLPELPRR